MDYEMEMEVFRAGDYGPRGVWSEDDLERIAADYSPQVHEAPVTLDHSQNGPALGWVRALRRVGQALVARLGGLDAEFLKRLKDGAFKKRSVELYRQAPATGRPYLRAVTFLGAAAPAVKGLADPVFTDNPVPDPVFSDKSSPAPVFSDNLSPDTVFTDNPLSNPVFTDNPPSTPSTPSTLSTQSTPHPSLPDSVAVFCERLRREGRLLPNWEAQGLRAFLAALDDTTPVTFAGTGGDSESVPQTCRAWFQAFLESLAPLVPLGETVPASPMDPDHPAVWSNFSDPGPSAAFFDPSSVTLHQRVCRLRHTHPHLSYSEALGAVADF
ncbi:MAG TPA: hypothetical protein PLA90_02275 [Candidatus Sumerlaeota bacterium]|nr:hypothetical protein [Candidatus Sumerlaeota bacterium]